MTTKFVLIAGIIFSLQLSSAMSAAFGVFPTKLNYSKDQRAETLTVYNQDNQPISVHLKAMEWTQHNGEDVYKKTSDIIAVPNIIKIQPQSSHTVRIINKAKHDPTLEKAYRLYVHELPVKQSKDTNVKLALNFLVCMGIPVFVAPLMPTDGKTRVALEWDKGILELKNLGRNHIHMIKLRHHPHEKKALDIFQYVLPNQSVPVASTTGVHLKDSQKVLHKANPKNGDMYVFHIGEEVVKLNVPPKP